MSGLLSPTCLSALVRRISTVARSSQMLIPAALSSLFFSSVASAAPNPPVHTVININSTTPNPGSSSPKRMFQVTYTPFGTSTPVSRTFFVASSNLYGSELWIT
ncbi:MAG TPA: hypothetical protein VGE29_12205, partial [Prosthecobacter sp.]